MKAFLLSVFALVVLAAPVQASVGTEVGSGNEVATAPAPNGDVSALEQFFADNGLEEGNTAAGLGVWHCTAYPNGHGHGHGHDAYDVHYSHAYNRALRSCQYYHGYCHVHCHYDWH